MKIRLAITKQILYCRFNGVLFTPYAFPQLK